VSGPAAQRPLAGVRICLVFEHSLSHYSRLLTEIRGLQEAGAEVSLLTAHPGGPGEPPWMSRTMTPLDLASAIPPSTASMRPVRVASNLTRGLMRRLAERLPLSVRAFARIRALKRLARTTDIFWVIDFPSLPSTLKVALETGCKVVYETVDLVPEYLYRGPRYRDRQLRAERALIDKVDGFITACDSYADYYVERYGDVLERRPTVRDNMPEAIAADITPRHTPLKLLFLGSLMFDRPIVPIIESMVYTTADVVLTLQGKNLVGDPLNTRIRELGVAERVRIVQPCAPDRIVEAAHEHDVGIVALSGADENERRAATSKLFTYMAAGLAVLGSNLPGIGRAIDAAGSGCLVTGMQARDWARAIDEVASLPETEIEDLKRRSLVWASEYAWPVQKPRFIAEFVRALDALDP